MRCLVLLLMLVASSPLMAASKVKVTEIVGDLATPWGVAVQPNGGDLFVAESGKGRILRVTKKGTTPCITGFNAGVDPKATRPGSIALGEGPLSLLFVDRETLVAVKGRGADTADALLVYALPPIGKTKTAAETTLSIDAWTARDKGSKVAFGLRGLAVNKNAFIVASDGGEHDALLRIDFQKNKASPPQRLVRLSAENPSDLPRGVTISPEGIVVVGQASAKVPFGQCDLAFYDAESGALLSRFGTGLRHMVSLAYHPKTGQLYALDFDGGEHLDNGLYRLDGTFADGKPSVRAVKLVHLARPTAMAIGSNGAIYITVLGELLEDEDRPAGKLLRIEGEL